MSTIDRRTFIGAAVASAAALVAPRPARAADARIDVLLDEPIGTINPDVYGHFTEHLGAVIYDGLWVGEGSKIPNTNGIRTALVDELRRVKPSVIRYPGGCFADSYDWRDGVGPRRDRPRRANFWGDVPEPNQFGTNEFAAFCRLVGARPYLAANLRGLPAQRFYEWVDYCNSPAGATSLGDLRASGEAGSRDPFDVKFWGVGNESWGCGGNFEPDEYATEFIRFTTAVPHFGKELAMIASGPNDGELAWTRRFFAKVASKGEWRFGGIYGWALHHYSWNVSRGATTDWDKGKGDGLKFSIDEWYELLREGDKTERLITDTWAVMGEFDRQHRTKLAVDEWGAWYKPGSEVDPSHLLGQQSTLRDALLAGVSLDIFNRHADKVAMANVAQLVNCLQSLFLTHEDRFVVTPTFHVFEMYAPHQGATAVRSVFESPRVSYSRVDGPGTLWGLNGSASVSGKTLTLTVVNPHASEPREAEVAIRGARPRAGRARTLTASDIHAHNSFASPRALEPRDGDANVRGASTVYRFPAASVTRLQFDL
jgi:alpha-N-arabinofuranosidase